MKKKKPDNFYLNAESMLGIKHERTFKVYVRNPLGINLREFCFVFLEGKRYLADVITGSLYSTMTGYCMSTRQLKLVGGVHD